MRPVSEILASALERLGPNGEHWMQGRFGNECDSPHLTHIEQQLRQSTTFCAYGAISRDMLDHGERPVFSSKGCDSALHSQLEVYMGDGLDGVVNINDSAKSFERVKEMFCRGIKTALAQEEKTDAQ